MVLAAEPDYYLESEDLWAPPDDTGFSQQWGLGAAPGIRAQQVWTMTTGETNPRINVGIFETGFTLTTPDTSFWPWQNNSITFTSRRLNAEAAVATVATFTVRNLTDTTAEITGVVGNPTGSVVIPEFANGRMITEIGASAFAGTSITSVSFASGSVCQIIGNSAFANCTFLSTITLPNSVGRV